MWNWIGNAPGIQCGFCVKYAVTGRYSGLSGVKVAAWANTSSRLIERYEGEPQNGFHVIQRCNQYTGIRDTSIFLTAQACFYLRLRSKSCRFGHTPVEGRSDGTRGEPLNNPRVAPEVQQKPAKPAFNQRPCRHSNIRNRAAHTFPIQFPVLYYPWC